MNAVTETTEAPAGTALTVQARAAIALGAAEHEKRLIALAAGSTAIVEIRDSASYQECHGARMSLKRARLEIEGLGEGAREDARNFAKAVIQEQKRLVAIVEPEELRLQEIERAHDAKIEAEREAKRLAEQNRIAMIQAAMDEIRMFLVNATGQSAAVHAQAMDELERFQIEPARFAEFTADAEQLKVATMNKLAQLHAAKEQLEAEAKAEAERLAAEQARIKAESEELARRQAEQAAAEKKARKEAVERERQQKADMEAAIARRLAEDKAARERMQAEEAAAKARIEAQEREAREARAKADKDAMDARIAEEGRLRAVREAEEKRLRAEADRLAKERQAAEERGRKKQEAIEAKAKAKREKEEAAERARLAAEQEKMDAREMLEAWVTRFGHLPEYKSLVAVIEARLAEEPA